MRTSNLRRGLVLALSALPATAPIQEPCRDVLCLSDGRMIEGKKLARTPEGVRVSFANGTVLVPDRLILDCLIADAPLPEPKTEEEKAKAAKGFVRFEGKWIPARKREELIQKRLAERQAEFAERRKHTQWKDRYQEETKHFSFGHTLPPEIYPRYRDIMEVYFETFVDQWKIKIPRDLGRLPVFFYVDEDQFHQASGAEQGVLGWYMPIEPHELHFFYDRLDPARTEWVMFHESNHYLQNLIDLQFLWPHFPRESVAEYYGGSHWDPETKKLTTGLLLEGRLAQIQVDIAAGEWMGLEKMLSSERMFEHYSWGWSLVHFLMNDKRYALKFQKFIVALPLDKDIRRELISHGKQTLRTLPQAAVLETFQRFLELKTPQDMKVLEQEWHGYVKEKVKVVTVRGLEQAADDFAQKGLRLKAKRLFKEAIDGGSQTPLTFHRYAEVLESTGEVKQAIEMWHKALELDPTESRFYLGLGFALKYRGGDAEEGERLIALAREISPDDPMIEIELEKALKEAAADDGDEDEGG